jgi:hypothetical protein
LANQTRALLKKQSQAASHVHHLPIKPPQKLASLRVPETVAQVQTSSHVKMVAEVARISALQTPMLLAHHAPRVHSSKLVLQRLTVIQVARHTETAMIALLAKTAADTRVVQSVLHTVAMIARLVATAQPMAIVTHVLHTVVQVQLPVVATVVK